jgi:hypothetical protein
LLDGLSWETGVIAALIVAICLLSVRVSPGWRGVVTRVTVVVVALSAVVGYFRLAANRELAADRRAVQTRQAELASRALSPGSPLACLDGDAGEVVETGCEKAIFAKPEITAAAVTYVTARLSLLGDAIALGDDDLTASMAGLRRSIELDRYGIVAHVLATRDGCSVETCSAFAWIDDPTALKANLKAHAFDGYVQRYASAWNKPDEPAKSPAVAAVPPADATPNEPPTVATPLSSRYDFPSAASIPPVSIMNKEPPRLPEGETAPQAVQTPQDAQSAQTPNAPQTPIPPKRPQTQGAAPR